MATYVQLEWKRMLSLGFTPFFNFQFQDEFKCQHFFHHWPFNAIYIVVHYISNGEIVIYVMYAKSFIFSGEKSEIKARDNFISSQ